MNNQGSSTPSGALSMLVIRGEGSRFALDPFGIEWPELSMRSIVEHGMPKKGLPDEVNEFRTRNMPYLWRGFRHWAKARAFKVPTPVGALWMSKVLKDGTVVPYGLASLRVVTTAGVNKIVAVLNTTDAVTAVNFKFHGYGTGSTAEAAGDTALVTELNTEYVGNVRPTGSQTVGASNNIYRTVGTLTPDSGGTIALREHGVFSANAAGTLLDRTVFAAVNLDSAAGDSLQTTYELTLPAGS